MQQGRKTRPIQPLSVPVTVLGTAGPLVPPNGVEAGVSWLGQNAAVHVMRAKQLQHVLYRACHKHKLWQAGKEVPFYISWIRAVHKGLAHM